MLPEEEPASPRFRFKKEHDHLLRAILMIATFFLALIFLISYWFWQRPSWQRINVAVEQPVPFSHKHHAGDLGIDCRYCHTGAETSSYAGIPPTETCMTCHSQIWTNAPMLQPVSDSAQKQAPLIWRQVTNIPNYVYFNHSVHVQRGVACVSCHGQVSEMPMTYQAVEMNMSWCLDCHRHPEQHLVPRSQVTQPFPQPSLTQEATDQPLPLTASEKARLTNCTVCHR